DGLALSASPADHYAPAIFTPKAQSRTPKAELKPKAQSPTPSIILPCVGASAWYPEGDAGSGRYDCRPPSRRLRAFRLQRSRRRGYRRRGQDRLSSRPSEEHTSELQSRESLVCRLLLEKKKKSLYYPS